MTETARARLCSTSADLADVVLGARCAHCARAERGAARRAGSRDRSLCPARRTAQRARVFAGRGFAHRAGRAHGSLPSPVRPVAHPCDRGHRTEARRSRCPRAARATSAVRGRFQPHTPASDQHSRRHWCEWLADRDSNRRAPFRGRARARRRACVRAERRGAGTSPARGYLARLKRAVLSWRS